MNESHKNKVLLKIYQKYIIKVNILPEFFYSALSQKILSFSKMH